MTEFCANFFRFIAIVALLMLLILTPMLPIHIVYSCFFSLACISSTHHTPHTQHLTANSFPARIKLTNRNRHYISLFILTTRNTIQNILHISSRSAWYWLHSLYTLMSFVFSCIQDSTCVYITYHHPGRAKTMPHIHLLTHSLTHSLTIALKHNAIASAKVLQLLLLLLLVVPLNLFPSLFFALLCCFKFRSRSVIRIN